MEGLRTLLEEACMSQVLQSDDDLLTWKDHCS